MPAKSKAQQRYMAMAEHHPGAMRGRKPRMSRAELHKFAATKTAGLPEHTKTKRGLARLVP